MQLTVQNTWGHLVVWYLFLAGAGAGLYIIAVGLKLWKGNTAFEKMAYYISPLIVTLGTVFLLFDLGQPLRAVLAILRPHSSMISIGTLILALFMTLTFWQAYVIFKGQRQKAIWDYTGLALAVGTATYTGLLLGVVKAIPFWNNPMLPILFLLSALSSGLGLILASVGRTKLLDKQAIGESLETLLRLDVGLVITEAVFIMCLLLVALNGNTASGASAIILLSGFFAVPFWLFIVGAGVAAPLTLKFTGIISKSFGPLLCGVCLLIGALALRYGVVVSGVWISL